MSHGYMSRKIRKFRTDKFDTCSGNFDSCNSCKRLVHSCLHETIPFETFHLIHFKLFHSNLSVRNFRFFSAHISGVDSPPSEVIAGAVSPTSRDHGARPATGSCFETFPRTHADSKHLPFQESASCAQHGHLARYKKGSAAKSRDASPPPPPLRRRTLPHHCPPPRSSPQTRCQRAQREVVTLASATRGGHLLFAGPLKARIVNLFKARTRQSFEDRFAVQPLKSGARRTP